MSGETPGTVKPSLVEELTWRETEILELLSDRLSDQEIALHLSLAVSTVKWYARQIYGKLGVENRREAIQRARELGLLHTSQPALATTPPISPEFGKYPTGIVTFLFTDLEGSTPLWESMPEAMQVSVAQYHNILQQSIENNGGQVFQILGDAFQGAFRLASDALCAALAAQHALQEAHWGPTGPLKVRMGLHTGPADVDLEHKAPYQVSYTLNRAGRIMSAGYGGQILLSAETASLVDHELPDGATLKNLGEHRMKGMARTEILYQVLAPDLPQVFPSLATAVTRPNNLPVQATSFLGRQKEVQRARDLILQDTVRLMTITGIGGTGKTRLALQVCVELLGDPAFQDGIFFINLASIRDPGLVILTIAQTIGASETAGRSIMEFATDALRNKRMLLLLDNFEQVISAAPLMSELSSTCPGLKIIVTSREPLHLQGEQEFPLTPLPLPDLRNLPKSHALSQYTAIELFMQRAKSVKPSFSLTDQNARAIAEICARVDGLPLGIELAAARVKFFSPHVILHRLEHRLAFLTGGARDLPGRQQTLRNTLDWSYELLSESQQTLLYRMSVFIGGCTLEAVETVCNADRALKDEPLDLVASLIDQNLLRQDDIGEEPRFNMLEVIREYGLERLAAAGEVELMRKLHANYYLALAEQADLMIETPEQALWLDRLQWEYDNLRAALDWFADSLSVEEGLRACIAQWRFWEMRGYLTEGRARLAQMLELPKMGTSSILRMKALYAAGVLAYAQCDYQTAGSLFEENLGISRKVGEPLILVTALNNLGNINDMVGDYPRAKSRYAEALEISRELKDSLGIAWGLKSLANVASRQGNDAEARSLYEEALEMWKQVGSQGSIAAGLTDLGNVASAQGDFAAASSAYTSSLAIFQDIGHQGGAAIALSNLGNVAVARGDYQTAREFYRKSLAISQTLGDKRGIAHLLESFANLAVMRGQPERAARLGGAAAVLRKEVDAPLSPIENTKVQHTLDLVRAALLPPDFAAKWAEGQTMGLDEATAYAIANDIS